MYVDVLVCIKHNLSWHISIILTLKKLNKFKKIFVKIVCESFAMIWDSKYDDY